MLAKWFSRKPEPRTFDVRIDGVTAFIPIINDGGQTITVSGWKHNPYEYGEGDYLIIHQENGETTRYQVEDLEVPTNPGDQYFARCRFAPRVHSRSKS